MRRSLSWVLLPLFALNVGVVQLTAEEVSSASDLEGRPANAPVSTEIERFATAFCHDCHAAEAETPSGEFRLPGTFDGTATAAWERAWSKIRSRQMPPTDAARPSEQQYNTMEGHLANSLDAIAAESPRPGRTESLRRLNRTEYQHAIRDLLGLEIDATDLLPRDESSHGFDNITVGTLSPMRLSRYIDAAQAISRLALGGTSRGPGGETIRIPADRTQEGHVAGLPLGTRGGALIAYNFPRSGEFELRVRLARDRNEHVEGMNEDSNLVVLLDRREVASFQIEPPRSEDDHQHVDEHLVARFNVAAGPHDVGVTFRANSQSLLEIRRQPYQANFNMHRHPRRSPAVFQISITGPWGDNTSGDSPSRRQLLVRQPAGPDDERACARDSLIALMRRAYRRPITPEDERKPMELFDAAYEQQGFDAGLEAAVSSILVSPHFLFRVEHDPIDAPSGTPYRISDVELASRLSFFLWSSIPDDELLSLAAQSQLSAGDTLVHQSRRMLKDERSKSLATNFASQWLHLRNLDSTTPDLRLFPDFDDNLRGAMKEETERLFQFVQQADRSVLELLSADYTFLNERLAKHYGVPHVYGDRFRQVDSREFGRGGLLRQGSILTVTSYATRTSPVLRGKWILENVLGSPPPPPPANVPALKENTVAVNLSVRERLAEHRANAACASCHDVIDPLGFALERFDAVGRWRTHEDGIPVDSSAQLNTGQTI
ncbi:MAG: DUF1592 domain-containing protein, partial [Planctomycetales bacterium]|nr:DUF1592 domain-containing protein [Planctomycetales bacterium]